MYPENKVTLNTSSSYIYLVTVFALRTVPPSCALSTIVFHLLQIHLEKVLERPSRTVQERKPLCRREVSKTLKFIT